MLDEDNPRYRGRMGRKMSRVMAKRNPTWSETDEEDSKKKDQVDGDGTPAREEGEDPEISGTCVSL